MARLVQHLNDLSSIKTRCVQEFMEEIVAGEIGCFRFLPSRSDSPQVKWGDLSRTHEEIEGAFLKRRLASPSLAGCSLSYISHRPVFRPGSRV